MIARIAMCLTIWMLSNTATASAQTPEVLNLSQDLVADGIAAQNMVPNSPTLDARPLFQAALAWASKNHVATVTADRGSYYFLTQSSPFQHVFLTGISNVALDLQHSDLYFANRNILGIQLANCSNVTLKNFTADYLQLPFTQVAVTAVNSATRTVNFTPLNSYPLPSTFNAYKPPAGYVDDGYFVFVFRAGQQLRGTGRMAATGPLNDSSIQITDSAPWAQSAQVANIEVGDTLVIERRSGIATIYVGNSTGVTVQNVSVYASGFIGVFTGGGSALTVDHVQVMPRPGTSRLLSTNADGIHLGLAGANNVISNNTVRRGGDDAIAIDGEWSAIVNSPNSGATVQVARHNTAPLPLNASFDFIDITTATVAGTAKILAENPAPGQQTGAAGELITLTLDHTINGLQKNFGVTATDPNQRGGGSVISGNLVEEEVFARGIYPAGVSNVTITDNLVYATNQSGILLEMDEGLTYNYKTGPASGISIQNNVVFSAMDYGVPSNPLLGMGGSINVVAYDENFAWVSSTPFSNISITGNFVANSIRSGIRMENAASGQISRNTVVGFGTDTTDYYWYLPACCETAAQLQKEFAQPIVTVADGAGMTNSNNVTTGLWIANVSYAASGYRLAPETIAVAYINGGTFPVSLTPAGVQPLPNSIGGITVTVKDSAGVSRQAGIYYVSPSAVCYVVPKGTAPGVATVTIGNTVSAALIGSVAPEIAAVSGTGSGVALAGAVRVDAAGVQTPVPVFQCNASGCTSAPIDLGTPTDTVVVVLYGTGLRGNSGLANVAAQIGGAPAQVNYAGANSAYDGFDQVNVVVPRSLVGAGDVPIILTVDGVTANVVALNIK